jgi:hypothetical protein
LRAHGITLELADNPWVAGGDWAGDQALGDGCESKTLAARRHALAEEFGPLVKQFRGGYHGSLMPVEYAWDVGFRSAAALRPGYEEIRRPASFTVKAPDSARFLNQRLSPEAEAPSDFPTRVAGPRLHHQFHRPALKTDDQAGRVLRLECVRNDASC